MSPSKFTVRKKFILGINIITNSGVVAKRDAVRGRDKNGAGVEPAPGCGVNMAIRQGGLPRR